MSPTRHIELKIEDPALRRGMESICAAVKSAGGRAFLVGGCVRDAVLDLPAKDIDIEVFDLAPERLVEILDARFQINLVGQAFGIIKIQNPPIDVSIPRRESKAGLGHRGFEILSDPAMSREDAAARRDFTMNAIALDPWTGEAFDPLRGLADIDARILRHTTEKFGEDPLRVLRAMQFAARFDLEVAPETVALCRTITPEGLACERIFDEWQKLILRGRRPSRGLTFLRDCGWSRYYPELDALIDCEQDPTWHPEGDVWIHTLYCMDAFADERIGEEWEDLVVGFAVLCHDFGKPMTTQFEDGHIRSRQHEQQGEAPTRAFLARMTRHGDLADQVVPLVVTHLRPQELYKAQAGASAVRRLARHVHRIDRLVRVAKADQRGRPPQRPDDFVAGEWLLRRARELKVEDASPKRIVMGRHLIELGLEPGELFGPILEACFEAQLEGEIGTVEEGLALAQRLIEKRGR